MLLVEWWVGVVLELFITLYTINVPYKIHVQLLKLVDQDQIQQMTNQYSDKVKEFDQRWDEYDRRSVTPTPRDWQKEVAMKTA